MLDFLLEAAKLAYPKDRGLIKKNFWLACIGIRSDQTKVFSRNGAVMSTQVEKYYIIPEAHAECRLAKKLDKGAIVFVARVAKKDGSLAMARPCSICQIKLRSVGVKKAYYTIDNDHYGILNLKTGKDKIICCR